MTIEQMMKEVLAHYKEPPISEEVAHIVLERFKKESEIMSGQWHLDTSTVTEQRLVALGMALVLSCQAYLRRN